MNTSNNKPFKIYNASAGSGKTYNLVKEYIKLLLGDKNNTYQFAHTIAMTFTNKAALEMKGRIIQALDVLSFPLKYKEKSTEYAFVIAESLNLDKEEVHVRAQIVLKNILHRYEDFNIMTIDKFNLKLIRSFSRDLNLPNDFEIILNENEVIERVVDTMMSQLGQADLEKLTQLVFAYAKENIEEGEKWDFRKSLIQFASILQKENYFSIVDQLLLCDFSNEAFNQLKFERKRMDDLFVSNCQSTYQLFEKENISEKDLPGASFTFKQIQNLKSYNNIPKVFFTDNFIKTCESIDVPAKKRFPEQLKKAFLNLYDEWQVALKSYTSLTLYIRNFYNMALLQFMAKQLNSVRKDEQLIRISEFNKLISDLVKNEDAPFIYERLGVKFHHFLLDEFQDTSHLQWLNMVPLLRESIAQKNMNLIVGDPKQSIYRFKNGVAEQFVELPAIYNPTNDTKVAEHSAYFVQMGETIELKENWRSSSVIVNFNNHFFEKLKNELENDFKPFYNSIYQSPKSTKDGYIEIISKVSEIVDESNEVNQLIEWIKACENDGYKRGDICILGNKNKECSFWAVALSEQNYEVVSADSLLVSSSNAVELTIAYLRRRLNPLSENEKRRFGEKFFRLFPENSYQNYKSYIIEKLNEKSGKKYRVFNDDKFIIDHFKSKFDFFTKYENIYDLIQKFYTLMNFDELSDPYLHHLADMAHEFDLMKGPDLKAFVEYYIAQGKNSAVQLPESENAIRIMSIHKSKGLEFPVVILPKMDFDLGINNHSKFLIKTNDRILYSPQGKDSPVDEIRTFTEMELGQIKTDSINKCYVAMTRPIERLYINNEFKEASKFSSMFHDILTQMEGDKKEIDGGFILKFGTRSKIKRTSDSNEAPYFIPVNSKDCLWFPDISLQDQEDLISENILSEAQRFGNQLHLLLSLVNEVEDIENCVNDLLKSGEIELEFIDRLKIELVEIMEDVAYRDLFSKSSIILNEQSIIVDQYTTIRPDKVILKEAEPETKFEGAIDYSKMKAVIIDYKTGLPNIKYENQVGEYALAFQGIGCMDVEAYLFYTATRKLIRVR